MEKALQEPAAKSKKADTLLMGDKVMPEKHHNLSNLIE